MKQWNIILKKTMQIVHNQSIPTYQNALAPIALRIQNETVEYNIILKKTMQIVHNQSIPTYQNALELP
jgi:hypothetical protein